MVLWYSCRWMYLYWQLLLDSGYRSKMQKPNHCIFVNEITKNEIKMHSEMPLSPIDDFQIWHMTSIDIEMLNTVFLNNNEFHTKISINSMCPCMGTNCEFNVKS